MMQLSLLLTLPFALVVCAEGFTLPTPSLHIKHESFMSRQDRHNGGSSSVIGRMNIVVRRNSFDETMIDDGAEIDSSNIASQLDDILNAKSSALLDSYDTIRQNGTPEDVESYLNSILDVVDEGKRMSSTDNNKNNKEETMRMVKLPWWTNIRITARISKRARIASLRRVLNLSTPTVTEIQDLGDDEDAKKRRRRRALVILLRTLASSRTDDIEEGDKGQMTTTIRINPIYKVEKAAKKDLKDTVSARDMESRLPPGLETPKYDVIVQRPVLEGGYEVRNYEAFSVCSVPMSKPRPVDVESTDQKVKNPQLAGASSFGALAGYLFGKNEEQKAMKMTTPVLTQGQGEEKEMSFVLPSDYWSEEGMAKAPTPLTNSLVQVKREKGGFRAAIMFGGFASSKDVTAKKEQLLKGLEADKEWVSAEDDVALAQYNDPFTPPWKRRNEVSVAVRRRD